MPTYKAPVDDALFLLNDVFHLERYGNLPGFADASSDTVEAILREAAKFCRRGADAAQPRRRQGRLHSAHADGSVTTPSGFKDAYKQIVEGGWIGISAPDEFGGQGLPATMTVMVNEFFCSANMAFAMYPGLTQGAIAAMLAHASRGIEREISAEDGRGRVDRHDEPDRAALRHRSRPAAHQSGEATGRQLQNHAAPRSSFPPASTICRKTSSISCSRASKARRHGTKGISLFIVPKFLVNDDGSLGARNARRLRLDRREDGHSRQFHLRDEL